MPESKPTPIKKRNVIERILVGIDHFQQKHAIFAFPYAIVKKYGDDEAGYQGALITYYGFLSLFPLLIVATSVIDIVSRHDATLRASLLKSITDYFPAIGGDLSATIHGSSKTGLALIIGLLITFWGTKGVADAVRHAINHIWEVPRQERASFPKGALKSLALIVGGGFGFIAAAILSSYATAIGHSLALRLVPTSISVLILFGTFVFIFRVASSAKHRYGDLLPGALVAAVGLQILQTAGGYLITHELSHLQGAYGRFGLVLAILFWLYLQAQVFLYSAEVNTVRALRLSPRSLTGRPLTEADRKAFELYAGREAYQTPLE